MSQVPYGLRYATLSACLNCNPKAAKMKVAELANSIDPDEVAQNEPPHLNLCCLPSSL